jgi:hypothetical protein
MADLDHRLAVLGPQVHDGVPLSRAAAAAGGPARPARRWRPACEAEGSAGLVVLPGRIEKAAGCLRSWSR